MAAMRCYENVMTTTKQQIWQNKINGVYCCCCRCILHLQQYSRRLIFFFFIGAPRRGKIVDNHVHKYLQQRISHRMPLTQYTKLIQSIQLFLVIKANLIKVIRTEITSFTMITIVNVWTTFPFRHLRKKNAKSDYELGHVCPHGTTRLPLDEFSYKLIFGFGVCVTVHLWHNRINNQLDATITIEITNKLLLLHLVRCLYYCMRNARSHKHQMCIWCLLDITGCSSIE